VFKEFKIGDLFDVDNTWIYGKNKQYRTRVSSPTKNSIAVISGITVNNGINYYTDDKLDKSEVFCNCLTISTRGEYSGTVTYHDKVFCLANNILTMPLPNWSKKANLYFATLVQKLGYGGYSGYPRKETLKEDIVLLPIKNNQIAFDFMESYISELEEERISELEEERISELEDYLKISGLDSYELTAAESDALAKLKNGEVKFREFKIAELFEIYSPSKRFNANTVRFGGRFPYVVRSSQNNGIRGYITEHEKYLSPANTFSFGQDTATVFYQENAYFTGDKIKIMKPKHFELNKEKACYLLSLIEKSFRGFSWGQSSFNEKILNNVSFFVPVNNLNQPDYDFMQTYIKAIEKKVIQNVVAWKDKEIEKTKEIVNSQ